MNELENKFEILNKLNKEWMTYDTLKELNEHSTNEFMNFFLDYIGEIREVIIEENKLEILNELIDSINNAKLKEDLKSFIEYTVEKYFDMTAFREVEVNKIMAETLMSAIFSRWVLYYDKSFTECYNEYGIKNKDDWMKILRVVDDMVSLCIKLHYSMPYFVKELVKETAITESSAETLAELISQNYMQLQNNALLDMLGDK